MSRPVRIMVGFTAASLVAVFAATTSGPAQAGPTCNPTEPWVSYPASGNGYPVTATPIYSGPSNSCGIEGYANLSTHLKFDCFTYNAVGNNWVHVHYYGTVNDHGGWIYSHHLSIQENGPIIHC